jgi:hypothetical protein
MESDAKRLPLEEAGHTLAPPGDCWCEPLLAWLETPDGEFIQIIRHQELVRPRIITADWVYFVLNDVKLAPEEGWDAVMSRESVENLLKSVHDLPLGLPIEPGDELKQRENESLDDFEVRLNKFLDESEA